MHPTTPIRGYWTEDLVADGFKRFQGEWTSALGGVRFALWRLRRVTTSTSLHSERPSIEAFYISTALKKTIDYMRSQHVRSDYTK